MSVIYDGDYTIARAMSPRRKTYPFEGDNQSFYLEQDFYQLFSSFESLPLDIPDDANPDAYLVHETALQELGGGIGKWSRAYAQIPRSRTEMESFAYTLPGVSVDTVSPTRVITSASTVGGNTRIVTSVAHGFVANDGVLITYRVPDPTFPNISYFRQIFREVISAPTTTTFDVIIVSDIGPITWETTAKNYAGRQPFTRVVASYLQFDYFLPGVSLGIASLNDIPLFNPVRILDSTGTEVQSYSATTSPTSSAYKDQVKRGELIVAEPSIVRRWMGNIYERATRYVKAV